MFNRILVPVDGSSPSDHALATACAMAKGNGAQLRLVHVVHQSAYWTGYDPAGGAAGQMLQAMQDAAKAVLDEAAKRARDAGVAAETQLIDGSGVGGRLGEAVARIASTWPADLIVVGTHGRSGPSRLLLGSGAEQIIRLAPVPVLVTREPAAS